MPAILPAFDVDSDAAVRRYFLPYQQAWIADDARLRLAEKSVRIGWTFADAFKNVRKRLWHPRRDYLFSTKDHATAVEYVRTCHRFAGLYNIACSILAHGVEDWRVPKFDESGRDTGFTEEIKVGLIKFDNGSRIIAFSSNPNALRAYGGDVGLDEFAFHTAAEQLWAAASGRVTWGFDLALWSSSNGDNTLFHTFAREAQAGLRAADQRKDTGENLNPATPAPVWSYYRVTLLDAVDMGLVETINRASGRAWTREEFIQDCRNRARLPEIFDQEYQCNPCGGNLAIVPWPAIERCQSDYEICRLHLEARRITEMFGEYEALAQAVRERQIQALLEQTFGPLLAQRESPRWRLGFDVAASGAGDLAVIYVDDETDRGHAGMASSGGVLELRGLFSCRTEDWHFLKTALFWFLKRLPGVMAAGDETGLGRQICWEAARAFPGRFKPVNFRAAKSDLGFALMSQLSNGAKCFPRNPPDIAADFFALRKTCSAGRWLFSEGVNPLNAASHCDIAWAGALSTHAAQTGPAPGRIVVFPRKRC